MNMNTTSANAKYECFQYMTTLENLNDTLFTYGVAIVPNVLSDAECDEMLSGIWDYFEHISANWTTPIKRDNNKTWKEIYKLMPLHSMLFQHFGVGHAQVTWDLRQKQTIMDVFSTIWGTNKENLLVSFDGMSFNMPPEVTGKGWNRNNTWYHTDQSFLRPELECIQSWVTALDVEEGDATIGIMEGSHRFHEEFAKTFNVTDKSDWYKLTREQEQFYINQGCEYKKIMCPKGSLVLWDSRTIHCGVEAMKGRQNAKFRAIVYLCYTPRERATESDLKKKIKAYEECRTTTHWPHKPKLFSKTPRTYGNPIPEITLIPVANVTMRRLIGYKE
jgi:ectoine hydroxylase-related dioxygenase (phytanoyl-CoA dioxygenase family)